MNSNELLAQLLKRNINVDETKINNLLDYKNATLSANEKFNLTAIKDDEFIEKMIFDSAIAINNIDLTNKSFIDVGTGAGYPGMVIKILEPTSKMTLLDSTNKKINFISDYCKNNGIKGEFVCSRCEEFAKSNRSKYDYAFARAVAPLNILLELIIPLLKVGGTFVALKGKGYEEEVNLCKDALAKLNCRVVKINYDVLPDCNEDRYIIQIQKFKETNNKYPRDYSDIKKKPL